MFLTIARLILGFFVRFELLHATLFYADSAADCSFRFVRNNQLLLPDFWNSCFVWILAAVFASDKRSNSALGATMTAGLCSGGESIGGACFGGF